MIHRTIRFDSTLFVVGAYGTGERARTLASYTYNGGNGKLNTLTYGNGDAVQYVYDILDRISEIWYNTGEGGSFERVYVYTYDGAGRLFSVEDLVNALVTVYEYGGDGRLLQTYTYDSTDYTNLFATEVHYDEQSRVNIIKHSFDYTYSGGVIEEIHTYGYTYDSRGNVSGMAFQDKSANMAGVVEVTFDDLGRTTQRTMQITTGGAGFRRTGSYSYVSDNGNQSGRVAQYVEEIVGVVSTTYNFTYDGNGNITQITDAGGTVLYRYTYDALGQLIREDNQPRERSFTYTYDNAGNMLSKTYYSFTTGELGTALSTYACAYGDAAWGDLQTGFGATVLEYDSIGNLVRQGAMVDGVWQTGSELFWQGRQLMRYDRYDGEGNVVTTTFAYNDEGIRIAKYSDTTRHEYMVNGSQILGEMWTITGTGQQGVIFYLYDELGAPIGLKYRFDTQGEATYQYYYFEKNLQGDVVAIYTSSGKKLGSYLYDAWGGFTIQWGENLTTTESQILSVLNPFRYRGYIYDSETGLYYLQSRYYNPGTGRFINADGALNNDIVGGNLFAYCSNNPISRLDDQGEAWWVVAGAIVGGVLGGGAQVIANVATGKKWNEGILGAIVGGAVSGGIAAATGNLAAASFAGAAAEALFNEGLSYTSLASVNGMQQKDWNKENVIESIVNVVLETAINGTVAMLTGEIAGKIVPINSGWFKPKKFVSSFVGKYALKSMRQQVVQSGLVLLYNNAEYWCNQLANPTQQEPILNFFPNIVNERSR